MSESVSPCYTWDDVPAEPHVTIGDLFTFILFKLVICLICLYFFGTPLLFYFNPVFPNFSPTLYPLISVQHTFTAPTV